MEKMTALLGFNEIYMHTYLYTHKRVVVQSLSHVQLFVTPWTVAFQASLSFTISQN